MPRSTMVALVLVTWWVFSGTCFGQDVLAADAIKGLKGVQRVAIVVRPNMPREVATVVEWGDMVEASLSREVPALGRSTAQNAPAWLELNVVTTDEGAALELSLYRWVTILDTKEDVFAKTWSKTRYTFGGVTKQSLRESLQTLITAFAADYFRGAR